jgi:hypothetical protein
VKRRGRLTLSVAAKVLAALLSMATKLPAQQVTPARSVKQEVPDNLLASAGPVQPIPYNHKTHLALGLQCQDCHKNPEPGVLMTFPGTSKCMQCHATTAKDKPTIQSLTEYDKSHKPVPWLRVYTVLPGVQWAHRKHLDAGIACEACHGQVRQMDVMAEVTSVTSMGGCQNCHISTAARAHGAKTTCVTCHTFPDPSVRGSTK